MKRWAAFFASALAAAQWTVVAIDPASGEVVIKDGATGQNRSAKLSPQEAGSLQMGAPAPDSLVARSVDRAAV